MNLIDSFSSVLLVPAGRRDSTRDVQSEQTKKKRKHGETYETLSENESEDDSEDEEEPTDKKTVSSFTHA